MVAEGAAGEVDWGRGAKRSWPDYYFSGSLIRRSRKELEDEVPDQKGESWRVIVRRLRNIAPKRGVGMHVKVEGDTLVFQAILRGSGGGAG